MACTQHIVLYPPPTPPPSRHHHHRYHHLTWILQERRSLKLSCWKEKEGNKRKRLLYAECSVALRTFGNIHGTACFKFVDLASIWFPPLPLCFSFLGSVFTLLVFAQENAVITSLAPDTTLFLISTLYRILCKLQQRVFWHFWPQPFYLWTLLLPCNRSPELWSMWKWKGSNILAVCTCTA